MDGWALAPNSRIWHAFSDGWSLWRRQSPPPSRLVAVPGEPACGACRKLANVRRAVGPVERNVLDER